MKASKIIPRLIFLFTVTAANSFAQEQFTHTVTSRNKSCNSGCSVLDVPELNNNHAAIVFVTPVVVNGANLNPHSIGASGPGSRRQK